MFAARRDAAAARAARAGRNAGREPDAQGRARHLSGRGADRRRRQSRAQLLETIDLVLEKVAARVESDAVVLVDVHQNTLAAAGRLADRWPRGRPVSLVGEPRAADSVRRRRAHWATATFRVVTVPLLLDDGDDRHAVRRDEPRSGLRRGARRGSPARGSRSSATGCWWRPRSRRARRASSSRPSAVDTAGGRHDRRSTANRTRSGGSSRSAIRCSTRSDRSTSRRGPRCATPCATWRSSRVGARSRWRCIGSFWLARTADRADRPAVRVARRDGGVARRRTRGSRSTGSSRELDALTETFNALMASVAEAEAQTEAAYTGAIRALAAALDARDPYTAGHSDRVSVLSVAIGRAAEAAARRSRGPPPRRAAPRHRQDWRARRRAAEAGRADARRVRRHQAASGRSARGCCGRCRSSRRTFRSSSCTTSVPTAAGIRTACAATTSRSMPASCTSPTPTTR